MKKYDAIVIGFGKGGKTLAGYLAKKGKYVALIERSKEMYGGTCINEGCIPSKSLILQADHYEYTIAVQQKEQLLNKLRKKNYEKLNAFEGIDIITAHATFITDHEVAVCGNGVQETLYGETIFINTGAEPIIPEIRGIHDCKNIYTSASLMKTKRLPKKLAIIGGGYIGLEFSSMYARYGSDVSVYEYEDRLVKREDADIALEIQSVLEKQGVTFKFHTRVEAFENENDAVVVSYRDKHGNVQQEMYDAVLLATGRKANTKDLGLENAGIELDKKGNIIVNEYLQTTKEHVFALGDVKGGLQFTYISFDDYRIVKDFLEGNKKRTTLNRGHIAYSVFISPTFSRVGLSVQEAKEQGYEVITRSIKAATLPRANVVQQTDGVLKAVVDGKTNKVLGCVLFCAESEEVINYVQLAMNQNLTAQEIANQIFSHPTMSESLNELFQME